MKTGDVYRHYKGGEYVVLAVSVLESTKGTEHEQKLVTYQSKLKKTCWTRTIENFNEGVTLGQEVGPRFTYIGWEMVTFDQYEELALRTATAGEPVEKSLTYGTMGLSGESGEVQGALLSLVEVCLNALRFGKHDGGVTDHLKKVLFHGHPLATEKVEDETGDSLWYKNRILTSIGSSLKQAAYKNVMKLQKRYPDGFSKERSQNRLA